MGIEESVNFREVGPHLTTSGAVTAEQLRALGDQGYDAVIDLLPGTHDQAVPGEAAIVEGAGLGYVHIPVDFAAPTRPDLEAFVAAMDALEGRKVHVHCAANWRVTAFYGLYAERKGLWTETESDAFIHATWDPADHEAWATFIEEQRASHR